jgi:uncharacterized membrane protein YbaN (DUF454 family)
MRAILRISGGIALVAIGIVGIIMPIMPGWVFIIPGLVMLSDYFPPVKRLLAWARRKFEENDPGWFKKSGSAKIEDRS